MPIVNQDNDEHNVNLILVFGCEPRLLVKAESGISKAFVAHIQRAVNNGIVKLPDALLYFNFDGKVEKTIIVS